MNGLIELGLEPWQWALGIFSGVVVGFSKTGIGGAGILVVPVMAHVFPARLSVGALLPMLCVADILAVIYYNRHTKWEYIKKPMPWALVGIGIGAAVFGLPEVFELGRMIGGIVLSMVILTVWREIRVHDVPNSKTWAYVAFLGILGGFATMVANAGGPVWVVYLLAMRLPKYAFIGTGAWFFLIINHLKVPLHIFIFKTITIETLSFNVVLLPAIAAGAVLGTMLAKSINEKVFRIAVIALASLGSLKLLWS